MKVSVVVPTKNSEEFLEEVLLNLSFCGLLVKGELEIIVVDNFSTDKTLDIAKRYTDKVFTMGPERVAQANFGISQATCDLIYLTGSDLSRDINFIAQCVRKIDEGYDAIYMSVLTDARVNHYWGRVKALERECIVRTKVEAARFFKKSVWEDLGHLNEKTLAMEEDFQNKLDVHGYKTAWIDAREYHLHEDDSLWKIFKKAYYYGKNIKLDIKRHKLNRVSLKPFLKQPSLLIGLIIYKFVQYTGGLIGYATKR